ncbi:uncharacterized protein LOC135208468 [Macrobrachium nipponense]|uniref:uncharacterized protein LOC135208468 n=1 Tax=Macrobrachium nipponense TaxID=159736 RepID=UPI0030C822A5
MDRGSAFLSELWASLARLKGTTLYSTTAYNPTANGMMERAHHSLKAAMMAWCTDEIWKAQLPCVLLGHRTAPKANSKESFACANKVYGEALARDDAHCPALSRPYRAPYHVITKNSKAYPVDIHGQENWVSVDRLKPAFLMDNNTREEIGRCPRIPPQNKNSSEGTNVLRLIRGRPRGRMKDDILAGPPDDPTVETAPQPIYQELKDGS